MARRARAGKAEERYPYGPRPIAAFLPALTQPTFRRRSPAARRLLLDWEAIVGPAIAAVAMPERVVAGTLELACTAPVALELQHLAPKLIERINTHLGRKLVGRLSFRQVAAVSEGKAAKPEGIVPREGIAPIDPARLRRLAELPEGELRAALAALARALDDAASSARG